MNALIQSRIDSIIDIFDKNYQYKDDIVNYEELYRAEPKNSQLPYEPIEVNQQDSTVFLPQRKKRRLIIRSTEPIFEIKN